MLIDFPGIHSVNGTAFSTYLRRQNYQSSISPNHQKTPVITNYDIEDEQNTISSKKEFQKKKSFDKKQQPFSKYLGRIRKIADNQDHLFGIYAPKYDSIHKKVMIPKIQELKMNNKREINFNNLDTSLYSPTMKLFNNKVIPLQKQTGRKEFKFKEVNEKRFEYYEFPEISTKVLRTRNITFKGIERNENNFQVNLSGLFYDKNFSQVEKKPDRAMLDFNKQIPHREINDKPIYTKNEFLDVNDSFLEKKQSVPIFDKMLDRYPKLTHGRSLSQMSFLYNSDQSRNSRLPSIRVNGSLTKQYFDLNQE